MVKVRKGIVEAMLLLYLDIEDLIRWGAIHRFQEVFGTKRQNKYQLLPSFNQGDNGISKDAFN